MSGMPVGIDLGTTYSLISVFAEAGTSKLVPGADGTFLTPSAVGLSDTGSLLVGAAAKARQLTNPDRTHVLFKRHMGTGKEFRLGRKTYSASDLSALVLRKLADDFRAAYPDTAIESLVVSVPAYFSSAQREATMLAAELAGLPRPRLVNEPTAAALAYGLQDREGESTFIVLDLGGGTFDVSIIEMFEGVMEVRASSGDVVLGGEDFTDVIARDISEKLLVDLDGVGDAKRSIIATAAEAVKRRLSEAATAQVTVPLGKGKDYSLTREAFEALSAKLLIALRRPIDRCLYDAGVSVDRIDRVVLVGGATRMPMIRSLAARALRRLPEAGLHPDLVVAIGASVQAALVQRNAALSDLTMTDVAPFSLGINSVVHMPSGTIQNGFTPIIERSTILPASRSQRFSTIADQQAEIEFGVFQGESPMAFENARIGEGKVRVPRAPAGQEGIDVRFSYDTSGLLHVGITVVSTGQRSEIVIEGGAQSLSPEERKRRIRALEALMVHPRDESVNVATLERLKGLYSMLLGQERESSAELIARFEQALASQDPRRIAQVRDEVELAASRMEENYVR
ncbi:MULTISPECIES: Hsp70 family protein [unclassified Devosia]|uniref:Hsp70 family protein n=1 Tax=unclassified Devosia TaxID=196773 RepID=UPI000A7A3638|nr:MULTISPECIES: Hsp70 family protein [unclassified Devosia]MBN9361215.1 Hsp70 family protein [Devosia sp.]